MYVVLEEEEEAEEEEEEEEEEEKEDVSVAEIWSWRQRCGRNPSQPIPLN
jgi:hypothetical protein